MIKIAVDVGTTNIDMAFYDSDKNIIIFEKSFHNRQSLYGRDVINRINTVKRDRSFIVKLKELAVSDLLAAIDTEVADNKFKYSDIDKICLSGNTTMISILLEYDISGMGESPYPTVLKKSVVTNAYKIFGNNIKFNCDVLLTGCVSAFIGGDILSGYNYLSNIHKAGFNLNTYYSISESTDSEGVYLDDKYNCLFIDLGTNGEMILNHKGCLSASSAACGPAFEASLKKQNVYGSSALDALSLLLVTGRMSDSGILKDDYMENGININNIHITQDIIREILLAKAAIASCMETLLKYAHMSFEDIDKVYIAGGFGSYLNIDNAIRLGLIPKAFKNKTGICGNTSLNGALLILKEKSMLEKLDRLSDEINVVSLTESEKYNECLINNMFFKEK